MRNVTLRVKIATAYQNMIAYPVNTVIKDISVKNKINKKKKIYQINLLIKANGMCLCLNGYYEKLDNSECE